MRNRMMRNYFASFIILLMLTCFAPAANSAVPVALLSFTAETNEDKIEVKWTTIAEPDQDYFTLERSSDGKDFFAVSRITCRTDSLEVHDYLFEDRNPLNNISYYRLKQTDGSGEYSYSDIIVIKYKSERLLKLISCSVNNEKKMDLFYYEKNKSTTTLNIFDVSGKSVYQTDIYSINGINHIVLDVPLAATENYYLTLSRDNIVESGRINSRE